MIKNYQWSKSQFGIMEANVTFENKNDFAKDIEVRCDHAAPITSVAIASEPRPVPAPKPEPKPAPKSASDPLKLSPDNRGPKPCITC